MDVNIFKPQVDLNKKYAVAVPAEGGIVVPLNSYDTLEQLKKGYKDWREYASRTGLTKPVPIELLDKTGKCKILTDMIQSPETN